LNETKHKEMKKVAAVFIAIVLGFNCFGQRSADEELEKKIDALFESYASYNRFIGSVLISKDDQIIYQQSFGYADVEGQKENTPNSIFSIASLTKTLTAVGVMKLMEDGQLTLETPISSYFTDFIPDFAEQITIRHLLNHSSGMQANVGRIDDQGNGLMPGQKPITINELFEEFKDSKLKFEPGAGYEYNNFGYFLLAHIIEKVSGHSYADYMETVVFKPTNMKNTAVNEYKVLNQRAFPHIGLGMNEFTRLKNSIHSTWLMGAANINSTTGDLYRFMVALENGALLKPESVDKIYQYTQPTGHNDTEYGLGWKIENKGGEKFVHHTGLLPGITSLMGSLAEKNVKIIILSNATSTDLITESDFQGKSQFVDGKIIDNMIAVFQGEEPELLPLPVKIKHQNTADFTRMCILDKGHSLILTRLGDDYTLETKGEEPWSIFTYQFSRNVREDNKKTETALFFANAMSTQNFEGLANYGNDDMKAFLGTQDGLNQLKGMWAHFIKQAGEFKSYNIYKLEGEENQQVHIRFNFEKEDVGFVLGINATNQIQGMFLDDDIKTSAIQKVKLIPVGQNEFFINGHQNGGMQDLKITVSENGLIIKNGSLSFKAEVINPLQTNKNQPLNN
jgi:CubicO group peptidase (beta-lactamase class C family)